MPKRKQTQMVTRGARRRCEEEQEEPVPEGDQEAGQDQEDPDSSGDDTGVDAVPVAVQSVYSKLGENVSEQVKTKIIEGKYVDLGCLLKRGSQENGEQRVYIKNGQLTTKVNPSEKMATIERWTDAFIVFIAIYGSAHPAKVPELLKYMDSVRLAAKRCHGLGWKDYDEQFRLRKGTNPESSWAKLDDELWLLYININDRSQGFHYQGLGTARSSGKCFDFNNKGSCFKHPCAYLHLCLKCSGEHPSIMCPTQHATGFQNHNAPRFGYPRGGNPQFHTPNRFQYPAFRPRFQPQNPRGFQSQNPRGLQSQTSRGRGRGQGFMGSGQNTY